ncbi:hypothetical protein Asal01_01155 [Fodinibius salicampi]
MDSNSLLLSDDHRATILISVKDPDGIQLIQQCIPDSLNFKIGFNNTADIDFDLCIMDEISFSENEELFHKCKEETAPLFLPFLLLSANRQATRQNETIWEFVDDVVYTPITPQQLKTRIKILLKQRSYSLKLEQKNKELAKKNEQLKTEKEKFQLLAENSTDMISRHAPDGTYKYVSQSSKELIGYEPEELVGHNGFDNMHPEDRSRLEGKAMDFQERGEIQRWVFRKGTKLGTYKWTESVMRPIFDENGDLIEIQASTRDISDRKRYEQKLEEEKAFTNTAIGSLPGLFYVVDKEGNYIRWNDNFAQELGYSGEEIAQMDPLDFYQQEDHDLVKSKIAQAFETGHADAEVELKTKEGALIPYYITAKRFTKGGEEFIVGTCMNLSEIKEAEYELEQQRLLLDAIINQTEAIIYVKDSEGRMRLVNNSYKELFGLEGHQIIGKTDKQLFGDELHKNVRGNDKKVLEKGQTIEVEEQLPIGDGIRHYHTIKYPLKGVPGFENCLCGISTDITDRKQTLQKLNERIKEQRCLYSISNLSEQDYANASELLAKAVEYLPQGLQYPDLTEAAITFDGNTFITDNFRETDWELSAESTRIEGKPLKIQLVYTDTGTISKEDPFLKEERQLLDSIVQTLTSQIDRILAREKLQESQQRWETLVQNDPNLIQLLDPEGNIKYINQSGAAILGFKTPYELIGKNYFDLITLDEKERKLAQKWIKDVINGKEKEIHTYKITVNNGTELYLESQGVPIKLDDGQVGLQLVAQDVTERVKSEIELKESLKEKETLLQEIHHRVKNNLAVVSGMLQLQSFNTDNKEVIKLLTDSEKRIQTMALIHEKLYESSSLSKISFGPYIKELIENIKQMTINGEEIDLQLDYNSFALNVNQAVPCALILNEVISNAYEHAFKGRKEGRILISIKQRDNIIHVRVKDNGRGLDADFVEKKNESLGFTIIDTLIEQLHADLNINNENGLDLSFSFDKQEVKGSSSSLI